MIGWSCLLFTELLKGDKVSILVQNIAESEQYYLITLFKSERAASENI